MARTSKTAENDKKGVEAQGKGVSKGAPKRPLNGYMLWLGENRQKIRDEHPAGEKGHFLKSAGKLWKELKDKSKWEKQAEEAKAQYEKDMADFEKTQDSD